MTVLQHNLSGQVMTFLLVATDHLTGATGQSPTVRFSKNGATAFSTATQAVTEMQYGWYKLTLSTNNVDTEGELAVHATATKADDMDEKHQVTAALPANVLEWATATLVSPNTSGVPVVDLIRVHGTLATTAAAHFGVNVYSWATATGFATSAAPGIPKVDLISVLGTTATTGAAMLGVNVYSWATATGFVTSNAPGIPKTDLIAVLGTTATTGAALLGVNVYSWATATGAVPAPNQPGRPLVDLTHIHGATATTGTAHIGVNVVSMATDSIVANTLATSGVDKIADQVWDELAAGHTATTSFGAIVQALSSGSDPWATAIPGAYTATQAGGIVGNFLDVAVSSRSTATQGPTAAVIADAVWDELATGHTATDTFGGILQNITGGGATASDIWTTQLPGAYATGSAGSILGRIPDVAVGSSGGLPFLGTNTARLTLARGMTISNSVDLYNLLISATGGAGEAIIISADGTGTHAVQINSSGSGSAGIRIDSDGGADGFRIDVTGSGHGIEITTDSSTAIQLSNGAGTGISGEFTGNIVGNVTGSVDSVTDPVTLTATERVEVADALLDRNMSSGTDSGSATVRTVRQALRFLRNKWSLATTGALTVYKEDDATSSWTATATGDSAATPVTGIDPA